MTASEAQALVATLAAAWPRQPIEQATLDIYAHDLSDLEFSVAAEAVQTVRRTTTFFPTIAEIRNAAGELQLQAPTPMVAYSLACANRNEADPREGMHPLVSEARRIVGDDWTWRHEPEAALRKAFLAAYSEVRKDALLEITAPAQKELAA